MSSDQAARQAALERLNVFLGEWRVQASFPPAAAAAIAGSAVVGRAVFAWILDAQFLAMQVEIPHPDAPGSSAIIGVNTDGQAYTQHYFDSRGVARAYAMTFNEGVWTLLRETPDFAPLDFSQRFTGRFSADGDTIAGRWELRTDGSRWEHDFDLTYTRLG
jgi:hypothetical protein